jgi:hypothetical protein
MSRRGVIMHYSYYGHPDHNISGYYWFKNGLTPPDLALLSMPIATAQEPAPFVPLAETVQQQAEVPSYTDTYVDSIAQQRPFVRNMEARPTPESTFISTTRENLVNLGTSCNAESSTIRHGELAKRLLAMQQEKNKAMEDKKIAILEAKYTARIKKAEEAAAKRLKQEQRKAEQAAARAAKIAQKKEEMRQDVENKKESQG